MAGFTDGVLTMARSVKVQQKFSGLEAYSAMAQAILAACPVSPTAVVIETPQQYPGSSPAPRSQVQALEGVAGAIAAVFAPRGAAIVQYLPKQWKGQLPKEVAFRRILSRLSASEVVVEPNLFDVLAHPASKWGHVVDAVGIGLHHLGRFKTR